ncbi:cobaltochelatase subunit CobN [Xylophilus sp. Kf1]|nr:cobaltochelatase subunit CobN [Xylophilus sp. Kf1]
MTAAHRMRRWSLAAGLCLAAVGAQAADRLLWLTADVTTASRTALVERLGARAGFQVRHLEYPIAGAARLGDAEAADLQAACTDAAMVWIDARHPSIEARLRGLLQQAPACQRPAARAVWITQDAPAATPAPATGTGAGSDAAPRLAAYLRAGGESNLLPAMALARALVDGSPVPALPPPVPWPSQGLYLPDAGRTFAHADALAEWQAAQPALASLPAVAVLVHRYHFVDGDTGWLDDWLRSFRRQGLLAYAVFSPSASPAELQALLQRGDGRAHPRLLVLHQLLPRGAELQALLDRWGTPLLSTQPYRAGDQAAWAADPTGLGSADVPFYLAQPEGAGAIDPVLVVAQGTGGKGSALIARQADAVVAKARRLVRLQTRAAADKRLVAMVYSYPAGGSHFGASFLNVPRSLERVSAGLAEAGYDTHGVAEADWIAGLQPLLRAYYPGADLRALLQRDQAAALPLADYRRWFASLPEAVRRRVTGQWGDAEKSPFVVDWQGQPVFVVPRMRVGNLSVLPQPPREETLRSGQSAFMHRSKTPLSHHYLAVYLWSGQADALLHFGTHGTQEWAPGKSRGLDVDDDALLPLAAAADHVPVVYPYIVDNLGEALTAKRRGRALLVSHKTPVLSPAGFNGRMAHMHELMHEWETVDAGPTRASLEKELVRQFTEHQLHRDLGWTAERIAGHFESFLEILHPYLDQLAQSSQPKGLAVFGVVPDAALRRQTILQALRKPLIEALGEDIDEAFLIDYAAMPNARPARWLDLALRDPDAASRLDLRLEPRTGAAGAGFVPNHAALKPIDTPALLALAERARQLDRLLATEGEMPGLLAALDGRFVQAAYGGDPIRNPDSLPTGRNLTGLDPARLPTQQAYAVARGLFDAWLEGWRRDHGGRPPQRLALSLWAGETLRQQGVLEAQAMVALGVRPVWDASGRPQTVALVPTAELGRARVDVLLSVTGSYRDQFPALMALLDRAVALAAAAPDEAGGANAIARNTLQVETELLQRGVPGEQARLLARARAFGNAAGDYGTGIAEAVQDDGLQRDDTRLGELFLQRMSQPYVDGRPVEGLADGAAAQALGSHLRRTDAAVMSRSSNLYGMVSSDDPFQYLGGLSAAARSAGRPEGLDLYVSEVQDSGEVRTESARRTIALEMQSRYLHPGWIEAQKQEGYAGTLQVLKAVQFAWGWQAVDRQTIRSDHWQSFYEVLVQDRHRMGIPQWMRSHPQAFAQTLERLVQAQKQGYWAADAEAQAQVARLYRELTRDAPLAAELASVRRWVDAVDAADRPAAEAPAGPSGLVVVRGDAPAPVAPPPSPAPPASPAPSAAVTPSAPVPPAALRLERQPETPPAVSDAVRRLLQLFAWGLVLLTGVAGGVRQLRTGRNNYGFVQGEDVSVVRSA